MMYNGQDASLTAQLFLAQTFGGSWGLRPPSGLRDALRAVMNQTDVTETERMLAAMELLRGRGWI